MKLRNIYRMARLMDLPPAVTTGAVMQIPDLSKVWCVQPDQAAVTEKGARYPLLGTMMGEPSEMCISAFNPQTNAVGLAHIRLKQSTAWQGLVLKEMMRVLNGGSREKIVVCLNGPHTGKGEFKREINNALDILEAEGATFRSADFRGKSGLWSVAVDSNQPDSLIDGFHVVYNTNIREQLSYRPWAICPKIPASNPFSTLLLCYDGVSPYAPASLEAQNEIKFRPGKESKLSEFDGVWIGGAPNLADYGITNEQTPPQDDTQETPKETIWPISTP